MCFNYKENYKPGVGMTCWDGQAGEDYEHHHYAALGIDRAQVDYEVGRGDLRGDWWVGYQTPRHQN